MMHKKCKAVTPCDILQLLRWNKTMTTQVYIYSPAEATGMGKDRRLQTAEEVKWYANPAFHLPRLLLENVRGE